jgi:hypothetical protein
MKRRQMCPNADCEKHGQPTGIMGGCDCGTALVPYKSEPTDEQLERTMVAMGIPANTAVMMTLTPGLREGALDFHALVQRAMNGDRAANERLTAIRRYFGSVAA